MVTTPCVFCAMLRLIAAGKERSTVLGIVSVGSPVDEVVNGK
jgi:hypothetical protein